MIARTFVRKVWLPLLCLMLLTPAQAADASTNIGFRLGCSGFTSAGTFLDTTRDNTGNNQEAFTFTAFDGAGNQIYAPETVTFIVGGSLGLPDGYFRPWTVEPQANPLLLSIKSASGNGFTEQVLYWKTGDCPLLTERGEVGINAIGLPPIDNFDGTPSASVPVSQVPPTATGINNIAELYNLSGFAIVNTPRLNMRTGAGAGYTRIAILDGGTELVVLGRNRTESWWFVQAGDKRGWVSGEYIALRGNLRGTSILPDEGEVMPNRFILYRGVALKQGPSGFSETLCEAPGNIEFPIIGRDTGWDWYQVEVGCNGTVLTGWLPADVGAYRQSGNNTVLITG